MDFFKDFKHRQWVYGVIVAGITIAVGYGFITSEQAELWVRLAESLLALVPAGALVLAAAKAKPAATDKPEAIDDEYFGR